MRLVAVGRDTAGPEQELFTRYAKRLKPQLSLLTLTDGVGSSTEIKRREAQTILGKITPTDFVIALDQAGTMPDSIELSHLVTTWKTQARSLTFIIGGAEGLDTTILSRANATLSLGTLTLPHMLARVVLAEQLYRAQCIQTGHPYHRAGRPG
jgi:23S rRNA (pseudouridine1915-N3)-methyltransferase